MRWVEVMLEEELWSGEMVGVEAEGVRLILTNVEGQVRAYEDRCPHEMNPLSDGELEGPKLTCTYHLWEFDAATGRGINPASSRLKDYPVRIENDRIFVGLEPGSSEREVEEEANYG